MELNDRLAVKNFEGDDQNSVLKSETQHLYPMNIYSDSPAGSPQTRVFSPSNSSIHLPLATRDQSLLNLSDSVQFSGFLTHQMAMIQDPKNGLCSICQSSELPSFSVNEFQFEIPAEKSSAVSEPMIELTFRNEVSSFNAKFWLRLTELRENRDIISFLSHSDPRKECYLFVAQFPNSPKANAYVHLSCVHSDPVTARRPLYWDAEHQRLMLISSVKYRLKVMTLESMSFKVGMNYHASASKTPANLIDGQKKGIQFNSALKRGPSPSNLDTSNSTIHEKRSRSATLHSEDDASMDDFETNDSDQRDDICAVDELIPILDAPDKKICPISNLSNPTSPYHIYGKPVGAFLFTAQNLNDQVRNLRQRAYQLEINTVDHMEEIIEELNILKLKIYADSTIRRGARSLRRNCFNFKLKGDRFLHIMCVNPLGTRKALKWTEERKEKFLAIEQGLSYLIRVYSRTESGEDCKIFTQSPELMFTEWRDVLHPNRTMHLVARSKVSNSEEIVGRSTLENSAPEWEIFPRVWNMSLQKSSVFYATIISRTGKLRSPTPRCYFMVRDSEIEAKIHQLDHRHGQSMLVIIPRLFSQEKADEVASQGIKYSKEIQVCIRAQDGQDLWRTEFKFEIGDFQ